MKKDSRKFALYYGFGKQEKLSCYEWIVVEPEAHSAKELITLKQGGGRVIAYLSIVEVRPESPFFSKLFVSDFLLEDNGRAIMNAYFGNYLADLRSRKWQGLLMSRIDELITQRGYDGLWLDTIGNLESPYLRERYGTELHEAYHLFIQAIRKRYPNIIIVQNNGLETVLDYTQSFADAVCWENPPIGIKESWPWVNKITDKLNHWIENNPGFQVLILEEEKRFRNRAKWHAAKNGWIYYKAKRDYL